MLHAWKKTFNLMDGKKRGLLALNWLIYVTVQYVRMRFAS